MLLFYRSSNPMGICQQVTLSGDAEWPKVADAMIEANRKANNRGLWLFVSVTLETVEQTDVMLHYTTMRGPGSQRDRAGTRWRRIAVAIRKGGSDGAVCGRIQDNARRGLDVKRVVMLRGMGLHGGQYFNCGIFKDEG